MQRSLSFVVLSCLVCSVLSALLCGCSGSNSGSNMSDKDERKIFAGDASKMPASARQQMEAAIKAGQAGAKAPAQQ